MLSDSFKRALIMLTAGLLSMELVLRFCQFVLLKQQAYTFGFVVFCLLGALIPYLLLEFHPNRQEWHYHWLYQIRAVVIPVALNAFFYLFALEPFLEK